MYEFDVNNICVCAQRHNKHNIIDQKFMGLKSYIFQDKGITPVYYIVYTDSYPTGIDTRLFPESLSLSFHLSWT